MNTGGKGTKSVTCQTNDKDNYNPVEIYIILTCIQHSLFSAAKKISAMDSEQHQTKDLSLTHNFRTT